MGANTLIVNPNTGTTVFGTLPDLTLPGGTIIPAGDILLKEGTIWREHGGAYGGFGMKHIWKDHHIELHLHGYTSMDDVPRFVSDVIQPGSEVFYEGSRGQRCNVLRSSLGIVILEYKINPQTQTTKHYVVSAYTRRNSRGKRVHVM